MTQKSKLSRATMIRRLVNAEAENLLGCDRELALPEILVFGFKGYGKMNALELMNEYREMFNLGEGHPEVFEPNEFTASEYDDDRRFPYFLRSCGSWDDELKKEVEEEEGNKIE